MRQALLSLAVGLFASLAARPAAAAPPVGNFDSAACDVLAGWAQDPDEPAKAIAVHVYFGGPAGSGAKGVPTTAGVYRADLCTAIGSCEHGFVMPSPLSLHDGQPHEIHAYGIDSQGGTNPEIGVKTASCPPGAPTGVRRKVDGATTADAWHFSTYWDLLPLGPAEADALPEGPSLSGAPVLVKADDASTTVWLVEGGLRREVSPEAMSAWRFDGATAETRPVAMLSALVIGTPLAPRPVLFLRGGLYLVDDPQPSTPTPATASSSAGVGGAGGAGGSGGAGSSATSAEASCGCAVPATDTRGDALLWIAGGALLLARARRHSSRLGRSIPRRFKIR